MNRIWRWLLVAVLLIVGLVLYLSRPRGNLNVTPDAEREIEKAKRR
jgi:hypothetical protein